MRQKLKFFKNNAKIRKSQLFEAKVLLFQNKMQKRTLNFKKSVI